MEAYFCLLSRLRQSFSHGAHSEYMGNHASPRLVTGLMLVDSDERPRLPTKKWAVHTLTFWFTGGTNCDILLLVRSVENIPIKCLSKLFRRGWSLL